MPSPLSPSGTPIARLPSIPVRPAVRPAPVPIVRLPALPMPPLVGPPIPKPLPLGPNIVGGASLLEMERIVQRIEQRRGVGLFRRLSIVTPLDADLAERVANQRTEFTPDLDASLFGLRRSSNPDLPGYDELGAFPMFTDARQYEYFVGTADADRVYARIPRRIIGYANRVRHTANELAIEPMLPEVGTQLTLKILRPVFSPLYYDKRKGALASVLVSPHTASVLDRYVDLSGLVIPVTVASYEQRTAGVACIALRGNETYHKIIAEVHAWREHFKAEITELITNLFDSGAPQKDILTVSEYLQHYWADKISVY